MLIKQRVPEGPRRLIESKCVRAQVAVVRSAVKLEQEQQFLIAKKLQELTGSKNIKLRPMIDSVSAGEEAQGMPQLS